MFKFLRDRRTSKSDWPYTNYDLTKRCIKKSSILAWSRRIRKISGKVSGL